jgi:hypothetical protein
LCDLWEALDIWRRSMTGDDLPLPTVIADGHPSPELSGERYCTRSQRLLYRDGNGNKIAQAHQYLREDGTIGGTAHQPDPKLILHEGTVYGVL